MCFRNPLAGFAVNLWVKSLLQKLQVSLRETRWLGCWLIEVYLEKRWLGQPPWFLSPEMTL